MRTMVSRVLLAGLLLAAGATQAMAGGTTVPVVPELSPASLSGGLALLAGGVLVLRARLRK